MAISDYISVDNLIAVILTTQAAVTCASTILAYRIGRVTGFYKGWLMLTVGLSINLLARAIAVWLTVLPTPVPDDFMVAQNMVVTTGILIFLLGLIQLHQATVGIRATANVARARSEGRKRGHS